MNEYMIV